MIQLLSLTTPLLIDVLAPEFNTVSVRGLGAVSLGGVCISWLLKFALRAELFPSFQNLPISPPHSQTHVLS